MYRVLAFVLAVLLLAAPAQAAAPRGQPLNSSDAVLRWVNAYRLHPDPTKVPDAMITLGRLGAFRDPEQAGVYLGFLAGVFAYNPAKVEALITKMLVLAPEDQWIIVKAVAYSGLPDWQFMLLRFVDRMPSRKVMIDKYVTGALPVLDQLALDPDPTAWQKFLAGVRVDRYITGKHPKKKIVLEATPDLLDTLWGYYFATGSYGPILRIIAMLPWSKEQDNVEKLTIGSMAKFTLASNGARDVNLVAMLKNASQHQPKEIKEMLAEVIEAAETVETAKLRKQALAAIEELKRKGPNSRRQVALWGQIGEGAISLGCLGAAVGGASAVIGLPCVVGGALTSATLKYWAQP